MNKLPDLKDISIGPLQNLGTQFGEFTSNFIGVLVMALVEWLKVKSASVVSENLISKEGIDKVGKKNNEVDALKKFNFDIKLSKVMSTIVYYVVFMVFVTQATANLGVSASSDMFVLLFAGLFIAESVKKFVVSSHLSFKIGSFKLMWCSVFFFLLIATFIGDISQASINASLLKISLNVLIAGIILAISVGRNFVSKDVLLNITSSFYSKRKYERRTSYLN